MQFLTSVTSRNAMLSRTGGELAGGGDFAAGGGDPTGGELAGGGDFAAGGGDARGGGEAGGGLRAGGGSLGGGDAGGGFGAGGGLGLAMPGLLGHLLMNRLLAGTACEVRQASAILDFRVRCLRALSLRSLALIRGSLCITPSALQGLKLLFVLMPDGTCARQWCAEAGTQHSHVLKLCKATSWISGAPVCWP